MEVDLNSFVSSSTKIKTNYLLLVKHYLIAPVLSVCLNNKEIMLDDKRKRQQYHQLEESNLWQLWN